MWDYLKDKKKSEDISEFNFILEQVMKGECPSMVGPLAEKAWRARAMIVEALVGANWLKFEGRPIKTLGFYYHRFRNGGTERVVTQVGSLLAELRDLNGNPKYRVVLISDEPPNEEDYPVSPRVLLINVDKFRKSFSDDFFLNKAKEYTYKWPDQDLLNVFCKGRIKCIDIAWNVFSLNEWLATRLEEELSDDLYIEYTLSRDCPKIIHFIMRRTLNRVPIGDYAEVYWKYAKNTSFYENLFFE